MFFSLVTGEGFFNAPGWIKDSNGALWPAAASCAKICQLAMIRTADRKQDRFDNPAPRQVGRRRLAGDGPEPSGERAAQPRAIRPGAPKNLRGVLALTLQPTGTGARATVTAVVTPCGPCKDGNAVPWSILDADFIPHLVRIVRRPARVCVGRRFPAGIPDIGSPLMSRGVPKWVGTLQA